MRLSYYINVPASPIIIIKVYYIYLDISCSLDLHYGQHMIAKILKLYSGFKCYLANGDCLLFIIFSKQFYIKEAVLEL